ncbi:peroxiredoxin-like family protein [Flagellimonas sp. S3867]|uniref:peroxiredoxin-like family protein n=1 Tax=Flagellimonas sp. S3867 TaxID=2768063 RepID=UPI00168635AE|nr:peroxiredoxin-like family protein [Flagellimonas sp. S3867]
MGKVQVEEQAKKFVATDYLGNMVKLTDYPNKRVLLSFFRGASCPFCNMRIHQLIKAYPQIKEKGIQPITVFAATSEEIVKYAGKQNAPFPIIADPSLELYKLYGIEESSVGMLKAMMNPAKMVRMMFSGFFNMKSIKDRPIIPADFLIASDMKIHKVYYGKDFGDHVPLQEILDWK